jgi:excinuclease ABC subunit B
MYLAPQEQMKNIIHEIQHELFAQVEYFQQQNQPLEAQRIKERVELRFGNDSRIGLLQGD